MNVPKRYTVTAALPYVNGPKHIGHLAGAYLPADIYVRYRRLRGDDVIFICGSDELGTAITIQALKENVSPRELVDKYHALSKACFEKLNISFDIYHRTTEPIHFETAQEFFLDFYQKGLFEEVTTKQYYDEDMRSFLADRYIQGDCPNCGSDKAFGDQCEKCGKSLDPLDLLNPRSVVTGKTPVLKETTNWYLSLEKYEDWLKEWLLVGKLGKWKANTYGQAKSWVDSGLKPRSMTRDGNWGVPLPLPNTDGKVLYVWFDAPIGYISATKQWAIDHNKDWRPYWEAHDTKLIHFVGKDNIVFHCIIFPIMLKASGKYILPEDVPANEFLNLEGEKMSTGRRWSLEMYEYIEALPDKIDELRYALTTILPETKDSDFTWQDYQLKVNSELVAVLANMVNRVFVLIHKFFDGKVPAGSFSLATIDMLTKQQNLIENAIERYSFREAMVEVMNVSRYANKLLTEKEPWKMAKTDKEGAGVVLHECIQIIANLSIMLEPFLPSTAQTIWKKLGLQKSMHWNLIGQMNLLKVDHSIDPAFHLFEKIDDALIQKQIDYLNNKTIKAKMNNITKDTPLTPQVSFEDFSKMDIRIGEILEAEKVEGTDKLMKLLVNIGHENRTIVSGVAHVFAPSDLIHKKVQVLVNLAPRKIKGIESNGMILFADHADGLAIVSPSIDVVNGSSVK